MERAAAYRHNRAARGCLPHYIANWTVVALVMTTAGAWLANIHYPVLSCVCWVLLACTISEIVFFSAVYLALTFWEF